MKTQELKMPKFRKKPVVIEAIKYDGENGLEICEFVGKELEEKTSSPPKIVIPTLEDKC